ncbi:putative 3-oxoacyl-reductase FabG [Fusarium venenatum]|uniref:putative 3-oxoacyl-reductase FabG n=1 Tax=Fusarium venenatum TaxID=56646 RepID=UPI001DA1C4BE|nr:putative 3-oxoacyl-reductase FabG [Fusarium venenatum]
MSSSTSPIFKSALGVPGYALVTGAGSSIGRSISLLLAREGCAGITLAGFDEMAAVAVTDELTKIATNPEFKAVAVHADVRDKKSVKSMIDATVTTFDIIDYVVNCAGIGFKKAAGDTETPDWYRIIGNNLTGVFFCIREQIRQMETQEPWDNGTYAPLQRGSIVNIASLAAASGLYHSGAYTATKHGVLGLTRTLSLDHPQVKQNAVVPGWIKTPLTDASGEMRNNARDKSNNYTPLKRLGLPEKVAEAVVWLLGD